VNAIFLKVLETLGVVISDITQAKYCKPDSFSLNPKTISNNSQINVIEEYDIEEINPRVKTTSVNTLAKGIMQSRRKISDGLTPEQYENFVVHAIQCGIQSFHEALAISPSNPETLLAYGSLYDNFGEKKLFENYLQLALDANPNSASVVARYGRHKEFGAKKQEPTTGAKDTPQFIYGKAIEIDPGCEEVVRDFLELLLNDIRRDKCDLGQLAPVFESIRNRLIVMAKMRNGQLVEDKTQLFKTPLFNSYKARYEAVWNTVAAKMPSEKRATYLKSTKAAIIGSSGEEFNCTIQ